MNFGLDDDQCRLLDTVRRFIARELQPLEDGIERSGVLPDDTARALHAKSKAVGLYALNLPAEMGGAGLSAADAMLCEEEFGDTTDILIHRAFGNVYEALLACRGEQVERWLLPSVRGERTCAIAITIAITGPGAGSDAQGIRTRAEQTPRGWVLNGGKHFISDGLWSDFFLVSARTGDKEISLFMVDKGLPGFRIGRDQPMMGVRGTPHVELFFDGLPLEPLALLGERGQGFGMAMQSLGKVRRRRWVRAPSARPATCWNSWTPMPASAASSASRSPTSSWCSRWSPTA